MESETVRIGAKLLNRNSKLHLRLWRQAIGTGTLPFLAALSERSCFCIELKPNGPTSLGQP